MPEPARDKIGGEPFARAQGIAKIVYFVAMVGLPAIASLVALVFGLVTRSGGLVSIAVVLGALAFVASRFVVALRPAPPKG